MKIKSSLITKGNFLRPMYVAGARNNKNGSVDREGRGHARAREEKVYKSGVLAAWENNRHFSTPRVVSCRMQFEKWPQKFHTDDVSLARSGQCPWLVRNLIHPIRSTTQNYTDLDSDASSVWNFCARSSDVISRGNQWLRRKTSAVFSGYGSWIFSLFIILCAHRNYNIIIIIFVIFTQRCQAKGF